MPVVPVGVPRLTRGVCLCVSLCAYVWLRVCTCAWRLAGSGSTVFTYLSLFFNLNPGDVGSVCPAELSPIEGASIGYFMPLIMLAELGLMCVPPLPPARSAMCCDLATRGV